MKQQQKLLLSEGLEFVLPRRLKVIQALPFSSLKGRDKYEIKTNTIGVFKLNDRPIEIVEYTQRENCLPSQLVKSANLFSCP